MANHKSAEKRIRANETKRVRNRYQAKTTRTQIKKLLGTGFVEGAGLSGLFAHFAHEWVLIANLFLFLIGFALLVRH